MKYNINKEIINNISEPEIKKFIIELTLPNHYIDETNKLRIATAQYYNTEYYNVNSDMMQKFVWECCKHWAYSM